MTDNPEQYFHYPQQQPQWPPLPPQPGVVPLRPLDLGAIISGAFRAVFRNWSATILLPFGLFVVTSGLSLVPVLSLVGQLPTDPTREPSRDQLTSFFLTFVAVLGLELVLLVAATIVTQSVGVVTVSRAVLGRTTSIGQALRGAGPRMLPLLGLTVLIWLMTFACVIVPFTLVIVFAVALNSGGLVALGFLLLLAGGCFGCYLWVSYALAPAALILEPAPVLTALRRSRWLVAGGWWRVFGILALCALMIYFASYLVELPVSAIQFAQLPSVMSTPRPDPRALLSTMFSPTVLVAFALVGGAVAAMSQAFMIGVTTLLYHDLRIRKESFHLPLYEMSRLPDDLSPRPTARPEATT